MESATCFDILLAIVGLGFYVSDIVTDACVAYLYYVNEWFIYFGLTLGFVIGPALFATFCSILLYRADNQRVPKSAYIFLILPLAPLKRYLDALYYAVKSAMATDPFMAKHYYKKMMDENCDVATLNFFEAFMESGPQVIMQLFIILYYGNPGGPLGNATGIEIVIAGVSIVISCASLAYTVTSYNVSLRKTQPSHGKLTPKAALIHLLWQIGCLSSRLISLSILFTLLPIIAFVLVGIHFVGMFIWLYFYQRTKSSKYPWRQGFYYVTYAFIHIFSRLNNILPNENTKKLNFQFYLLIFIENTVILSCWIAFAPGQDYWSRCLEMIGVEVLFISGIIFMIIYSKYFHPFVAREVPHELVINQ